MPLIWLTLTLVGFLLSWAFARELPDSIATGALQYTSIILMLLSLKSLFIMSYFSFVTLTTLGYGDISPLTPVTQVLVILEAITGMFYLAVIVASLIGGSRRSSAQS